MTFEHKTALGLILLTLLCAYAGWIIRGYYDYPEGRTIGLFTQNNTINGYFYPGYWIHININGISYEKAVETCNHEVAHEIYAQNCEKNITKCYGVLK